MGTVSQGLLLVILTTGGNLSPNIASICVKETAGGYQECVTARSHAFTLTPGNYEVCVNGETVRHSDVYHNLTTEVVVGI
jgi:hypothetical protein